MRDPSAREQTFADQPDGVGAQRWRTLEDMVMAISAAACDAIGWVDYASVSVSYGPKVMDTLGPTDPIALKADALQQELAEGPSLDAGFGQASVHARELGTDPRWPAYSARARELGIAAQTAAPVLADGRVIGVLNLYSTSPHDLDDNSSAFATLFASQAALAVDFASRVAAQTEAIAHRQVIGQALGLVMERFELDESAAFEHLVQESQRAQVKLRVVARLMVEEANLRRA